MALPHIPAEAPPNPLLARYRKINARERFYKEELAQDREISRAKGQTWEQIRVLQKRMRALMGLSETLTSFAFNVGIGDFDDEQWRKVYANPALIENYCELYETARDATSELFAP